MDLPALPALSLDAFPPLVRTQIEEALARARESPRDAEANGRLGMVLHAYGENALAVICYRRAHLLSPETFRWAYLHGYAGARAGERDAALESLRAALALEPEHTRAKLELAALLLEAQQVDEARDLYEQILARPDAPAEAHLGMGKALARSGDTEAAILHYDRALALDPRYAEAHYAQALAYRELGRSEDAARHFALHESNRKLGRWHDDPILTEVAALNLSGHSQLARGKQLVREGRIPEAIAELETALGQDPDSMAAHVTLVALYGETGERDKAEAHYAHALAINPRIAKLHFNMGMTRLKLADYAGAGAAFERAVELEPADPNTLSQLGLSLDKQGRPGDAVVYYERALAANAGHREANYLYGRWLMGAGRTGEAIPHLERAVGPGDERSSAFRAALALAYAGAGQTDLAIRTLEAALREASKMPDNPYRAAIETELAKLKGAAGRATANP